MDDFSGVDFNFSFAPGVLDEQIIGFELAGDVWSQYLHDTYKGEDLQINIHVEIGDDILPEKVVGGAFPTIETGIKYKDIYKAIQKDITTVNDQIVADNLLDTKKIDLLVGENIVDKNFKMHATTANLKALGMVKKKDYDKLDGFIVMNSLTNVDGVDWSYSYLEGPKAEELDFLSVAIHELGHSIGFISGTDFQGWSEDSVNYDGKAITHMTSMDLFRYSLDSINVNINDLTFGEAAYFTIDGTLDESLAFSTGADYQGSHWINSNTVTNGLGIMNPTIGLGERWHISGNDLKVMDSVGWDVDYTAEVDLEALFYQAQLKVDHASIVDRTGEVDEILYTEAYNWARRSSTSSSSGWWWARRSSTSSSSGWWSTGYWSTCETGTTCTDTSNNSTDNSTNNYWDSYNWESNFSEAISSFLQSFFNWDWSSFGNSSYRSYSYGYDSYSGWGSSDSNNDDDYSWWGSSNSNNDDDDYSWWGSSNSNDDDDDYSWWGSSNSNDDNDDDDDDDDD